MVGLAFQHLTVERHGAMGLLQVQVGRCGRIGNPVRWNHLVLDQFIVGIDHLLHAMQGKERQHPVVAGTRAAHLLRLLGDHPFQQRQCRSGLAPPDVMGSHVALEVVEGRRLDGRGMLPGKSQGRIRPTQVGDDTRLEIEGGPVQGRDQYQRVHRLQRRHGIAHIQVDVHLGDMHLDVIGVAPQSRVDRLQGVRETLQVSPHKRESEHGIGVSRITCQQQQIGCLGLVEALQIAVGPRHVARHVGGCCSLSRQRGVKRGGGLGPSRPDHHHNGIVPDIETVGMQRGQLSQFGQRRVILPRAGRRQHGLLAGGELRLGGLAVDTARYGNEQPARGKCDNLRNVQ